VLLSPILYSQAFTALGAGDLEAALAAAT